MKAGACMAHGNRIVQLAEDFDFDDIYYLVDDLVD